MSNEERDPSPVLCEDGVTAKHEVITPRDVPLGGLRAMNVRRTLPSRQRTLLGAWCFIDSYGPDNVAESGGMRVAPHPHIGLQTVSWLYQGEVLHRDSVGTVATVRPGELNLMTAGAGISHSENSTDDVDVLHGVQLWVALPEHARNAAPTFAHYAPGTITGEGWEARIFLGSLLGESSPVETHTPLLGAEFLIEDGAVVEFDLDAGYEHGVLIEAGEVAIRTGNDGEFRVTKDELGVLPDAATRVQLEARGRTRLLLLGGPPFGEKVIMWWNFLARTQEEILAARTEWQRQVTDGEGALQPTGQDVLDGQFGIVAGDVDQPIPAPPLPDTVTLLPRA